VEKLREWEEIFLKDARHRLQKQMDGYELSIRDVANMVSFFHLWWRQELMFRWRSVHTKYADIPLRQDEQLTTRRSLLAIPNSVTYSQRKNGKDINTDGIYTGITPLHSAIHSQKPKGLDMFKNCYLD
jgi:hypothetical protein